MNLLWHLIAVCITLSISTNCKYLLVKVAEEKPNFEERVAQLQPIGAKKSLRAD